MSNSIYLLDTCTLINLLNRKVSVGDRIVAVGSENCAMSVIFDVIPLPHTSDFAQIKRALENAGEPIGDADVMIAATAYVNNMTLVTNNIKHFSRIGNIQVVSW